MSPVFSAFCHFVIITIVAAKQPTVSGVQPKWPRLFHLDDYNACLTQPDGLYCLGTFHLAADQPNALYESLKNSFGPYNFQRTLIHRGYCVSARCPSSESNTTLRFERCVEDRARALSLTSHLQDFKYCRSPDQSPEPEDEWPYRAFALTVGVLLLLNVIGTIYDVYTRKRSSNNIVKCWSMKVNWDRLTTSYESSDPSGKALAPIQGARVILLLLVILGHETELTYKTYIANPEFLETAQRHPLSMMMRNGSAIVQVFIVLSNFLFAFILLRYARKRKVGLSMLPFCILYRIVRISPIHLLVVGFGATYWRYLGDGPLWSELVTSEGAICRQKFWSHAFFVSNLVEPQKQCMLQTWFLSADMQLQVFACIVTLLLVNDIRRAINVLGALFFASSFLNASLAYIFDWKPLLYLLTPENLRTTFESVPSFWYFYMSPWGSLPACCLGLLAAHIQFYAQEQRYDINKTKWLVQLYNVSVPLCVVWVLVGYAMASMNTRASFAAYIGFERPIFAIIAALCLYGCINNLDNWYRRVFAWRGWQVPARLSLSVLMLHRLINLQLIATMTTPAHISVISIFFQSIGTAVFTYLLAIPLTVMVELPVQSTFTALFIKNIINTTELKKELSKEQD